MMTTFALALAPLLLLAPQDDTQDQTIETWVETLRSELGLTEEQTEKTKKIVEDYMEKNGKLLDAYKEEMGRILNADQKESFKDLNDAFTQGGGQRNQGGNRWGGWGNWGQDAQNVPSGRELRGVLRLSDGQVAKLDELQKEVREADRERMRQMREGGWEGFDWRGYQREQRERRRKIDEKVNEILTEEQQGKLSEYKRNKRRYPAVYEAMADLGIKDFDEEAAIRGLVLEVAKKQRDLERLRSDIARRLRRLEREKDATEESLEKSLEEIRGERQAAEVAVRDAQKTLREVVSYRHEIVLVRHGILR